jgi:hypothetical protein
LIAVGVEVLSITQLITHWMIFRPAIISSEWVAFVGGSVMSAQVPLQEFVAHKATA